MTHAVVVDFPVDNPDFPHENFCSLSGDTERRPSVAYLAEIIAAETTQQRLATLSSEERVRILVILLQALSPGEQTTVVQRLLPESTNLNLS